MLLDSIDVAQFFRLHRCLMWYVNDRLKVVPERPADPNQYASLSAEARQKVHDALRNHMDLIQAFVADNPAGFSRDDLDIVLSWRNLVNGRFLVLRELKNVMVFLTTATPSIAYGVVALSQPFEEVIGPYLPVMVETTLLPFKNQIVYDGLMVRSNISFGPGARRGFHEDFKQAKARDGIITSLPIPATPPVRKTPKARKAAGPPAKPDVAEVLPVIVDMLDRFCGDNLTGEYAVVCRKLAEKLARKRPSPLLTSNPYAWAAGIVRTIGWVNFLHDRSQTPYMQTGDIDAAFGIGQSTGAAKTAVIRRLLKIRLFDPIWTLPSRSADLPFAWMF